MTAQRIVRNPDILCGKPTIAGTRISVECVLERLAAGNSVDALLDEWPHLTRDDLRAALDYAANAVRGERELPLAPKAA
jgi:uncharacterized protein (DUF433 family)